MNPLHYVYAQDLQMTAFHESRVPSPESRGFS
jgi:hypothetical protein